MSEYLIGIDIGTQGTKAVLYDTEMQPVVSSFQQSVIINPSVGVTWQDSGEIYQSCVIAVRELIKNSAVNPNRILAIGIDGQMAGIMGIDSNHEACTYYDSWLDTRCEKYIEIMRKRAGKKVIEITGGPISYNHGPKILWWKYEQPEAYKRIKKFVTPNAYVTGKITGIKGEEAYFDYTNILFSGFADNKNKCWSEELLEMFDISADKMARIVSPFQIIGKTERAFSIEANIPEGIPVAAGCGDTAASTFGAGLFEKGMLLDCAGTASNLCCLVSEYSPDIENETITMLRSPVEEYFIPLAYINGGGMSIRWFADVFAQLGESKYDTLEKEALKIQPGSEGLIFIPHFAGRVLPNNPYVKGSFVGLDWKHTRAHMYRAVMEGIAYEYRNFLNIIKRLYPEYEFKKMESIGGGAKSRLFNLVKANVLGVQTTAREVYDAAPLGSAIIAGVACGALSNYKETINKTVRNLETIQFDFKVNDIYKAYAEEYLKVIDALTPVYKSKIYNSKK